MEIRYLKKDEFYDLIELLDGVFGRRDNSGPRFAGLFPRFFSEPNDYVTSSHLGAFDGDRLIGTAGIYKLDYVVGGEHIKLIGNGNIAVHEDYQGQGVMSRLNDAVNMECDKIADVGYLHGKPERYGRWDYIGNGIIKGFISLKREWGFVEEFGFDGEIEAEVFGALGCALGRTVKVRFSGYDLKSVKRLEAVATEVNISQPALFRIINDDRVKEVAKNLGLDESVTHVLEAQHKTLSLPTDAELTEEESRNAELINLKSIYARTDDGVPVALDREGKHHFVVLTDMAYTGNPDVVTFKNKWHNPAAIAKKLKEYFPNSDVSTIKEFPSVGEDYSVIHRAVRYDDTVFITFTDSLGYVGRECLTSRVVSVIEALQVTNRVSTVVHFGNPFVLEELEHIPRVIIGGLAAKSVEYAIDVLADEEKAEGVLTYDIKLK